MSFLRNGFGGLILTTKSDERENWQRHCLEANRSEDLVVFGADSPRRFNPLDHERNRRGPGAGLTENIVSLLATVLEVAERGASGGGGREDEGYWRRANRQLCRNVVDLLSIANTSAGFSESYDLDLQPSVFTRLRTGGPANGWAVDGIVLQNGRVFQATGKTWLPVTFAQKP